jgi:ABC-type Fe3+/spermidine/putrescine transport system ATPase subunit
MITLQNLTKSFNGVPVVCGVTFEVASGESLALVGPSGSGKTTVLRLIAGFEIPDKGNIMLNGELVSKEGWAGTPHKRGIGMVFQKGALWPHMTVARNVQFGLSGLTRAEIRERLHDILQFTHLEGLEQRYPHQLSGGEAQRVALARALATRPAILLLDEPLVGLDRELKRQMIELIRTVRQELGTTIIYVTHYMSEAAAVTDRLLVLRNGYVEQSSSWSEYDETNHRDET